MHKVTVIIFCLGKIQNFLYIHTSYVFSSNLIVYRIHCCPLIIIIVIIMIIKISVSDPYHFDSDPDPRIRIRDDGSGSGSEVTFDSVNV